MTTIRTAIAAMLRRLAAKIDPTTPDARGGPGPVIRG